MSQKGAECAIKFVAAQNYFLIETYKLSKAGTLRAPGNLILQEVLDQVAEGNPLSICEGNPVWSIAAAYQGTG